MSKDAGIIRLSKWVSHFCLAALVLLPLSVIVVWWSMIELQDIGILSLYVPVHFESVQWYQWAAAMGLSMIPVLLWMWAIGHIYRLMALFQQSEYFSSRTSRSLHQFSFWLLISTLLKIICDSLMSAVLTFNNPEGGHISVSLDGKTISTLFIVSVFFVITRIMNEGIRLAEENAEFV